MLNSGMLAAGWELTCADAVLAQERTFSPRNAMSALCQKQTWFSTIAMSALCQKRTHAVQQKQPIRSPRRRGREYELFRETNGDPFDQSLIGWWPIACSRFQSGLRPHN